MPLFRYDGATYREVTVCARADNVGTWRNIVGRWVWTGGAWWRYFGGSSGFTVSLVPSPASGSCTAGPGAPCSPQVQVTATPTGNNGAVTYAWTRISGIAININDPTSSAPIFSLPSGTTNVEFTNVWRCTATDSVSNVTSTDVEVTLDRFNPGA